MVRRWLRSPVVKAVLLVLVAAIAGFVYAVIATPLGQQFPTIHGGLVSAGQWARERWRGLTEFGLGLAALVVLLWLVGRLGLILRVHNAFNRQFEKLRRIYGGLLSWALEHKGAVVLAFVVMVVGSCFLFPLTGNDFFPTVDAGVFRLHVRCPPGTRIE